MAKTRSILSEENWKQKFSFTLQTLATEQEILPQRIGQRLDQMPDSTGRNRVGDWSRYIDATRIPTERQIKALSQVLRIPEPLLRICAGYVDDIFECIFASTSVTHCSEWEFPVEKKNAALALLLSLFPSSETHTGIPCSLFGWMLGNTIRLNLSNDEGVLSGEGVNGVWFYPERSEDHLIPHHESPDDPTIIFTGKRRKEPWTWYSMRALLQVDITSPVALAILHGERISLPPKNLLFEAQQVLHKKTLPLTMRISHATDIVHYWADSCFGKEAVSVMRESLHPWSERTITDHAAQWVMRNLKDRPHKFWR